MMRLTCPNCDAQYDVPDDALPDAGRDVQCSNCGHTWWQPGPNQSGAPDDLEAAEAGAVPEQTAAPRENDEPAAEAIEPTPDPEPAAEDRKTDDAVVDMIAGPAAAESRDQPEVDEVAESRPSGAVDAPESETSDADMDEEAAEETPSSVKAHEADLSGGLDPEVARILREEADFERRAREADTLESQPDLGIDEDGDTRAGETKRRMARLRGDPDPTIAAVGADTAATRGDLLPDIEEINSTLRSGGQEPEIAEEEEEQRRRGFRFGFTLVVLLGFAAALAYVLAPQISASVPALEPALSGYSGAIDSSRLWLDRQMEGLLMRIDGYGGADAAEPTTIGQ